MQLELNRAFRDNWTLRTNYTWGKTKGNNFGNGEAIVFEDTLFDGLGGIEVGTGRTDATTVNSEGVGNTRPQARPQPRRRSSRSRFGSRTIGLGGYFGYRSGERWGLRSRTTLRSPVSGQTISTTTYLEPRDAEQLEDTMTLNLSGHWQFPIKGLVSGTGRSGGREHHQRAGGDRHQLPDRPTPGRASSRTRRRASIASSLA